MRIACGRASFELNSNLLNSLSMRICVDRPLVIKPFKSCFEPKFLLEHYRPVIFYKLRNPQGTFTLKTEALHLLSNVELVKYLLLFNE